MSSEIKVDTISEKTSANGVTIDGVNLKDSVVKTDTISEKTSAAGVTIDGALIKDNLLASSAGGGLVKLATATASDSAAITFDNFVDNSVYASYLLYVENHVVASDTTNLDFTFRTSAPADISDDYYTAYYERKVKSGAGSDAEGKETTTDFGSVWGSQTNTVADSLSATVMLQMPDSGLARCHWDGSLKNSSDVWMWIRRDMITDSVTGCKGIKLFQRSGNITSGVYTIYGVKK